MDTTTITKDDVGRSTSKSPLFRVAIRVALVALAFAALWFAQDRLMTFRQEVSATFHWNNALWITYGVALILGGFAFGVAVWMPFSKLHYMPSRIAFAGIASIPFLHTSLVLIEIQTGHLRAEPQWLSVPRWFDDPATIATSTALVGVAIASGFRAKL